MCSIAATNAHVHADAHAHAPNRCTCNKCALSVCAALLSGCGALLSGCGALQVDVEGWEFSVFRAAQKMLPRVRNIIMEYSPGNPALR
eukprot:58727-Chlamydomonas_euryale.AAC.1